MGLTTYSTGKNHFGASKFHLRFSRFLGKIFKASQSFININLRIIPEFESAGILSNRPLRV
jgi:hypothetical protein